MSQVPKIEFAQTGLIVPTEAAVLAGAQADINAAFGGNLNPSLTTPQGQIATSEAAIIADKNAQIATMSQQVDPDYATGRFQDAIGKYYFQTRMPATPTTTTVTCYGAQGTIIPAFSLCVDSLGNKYQSTVDATIPASGNIAVPFECQTLGPIALSSNDLVIYQSINGWDSVTNTAGVPGRDVESRSDFEYRRRNSVAANAQGSIDSVQGEVFVVDGVTDVYATENTTGSPITVGATSVALVAHSLYVCAAGGTDAAVADAIWRKKAPGCNMNGDTTVVVTDSQNYSFPYPQYSIKFERPAALAIKFLIQVQNVAQLPSDITAQVKAAIVAAFNGTDNGARARIGATIYAGRYYSGVAAISQYVNILGLFVGTGVGTPANTSEAVGVDQVPTLAETDITVSLI